MSFIAWLDASATEQSRMREFVRLNSDRESRDELGIGAIRDTISDGLFPGSSTLHTRARYLLLIPWAFQAGSAHTTNPSRALTEAEQVERRMITNFQKAGHTDGLIGADVGVRVKNLPSRLYWAALSRYGILTDGRISRARAAELTFLGREQPRFQENVSPWAPNIPPVPAGFPSNQQAAGFALSGAEANLMQEQLIRTTNGSLLAHLLRRGNRPTGATTPWQEPAAYTAADTTAELLRNGRLFSLAINGATLLYALLLAEEYERLGYSGLEDPVDAKREALHQWEEERQAQQAELKRWDVTDLWAAVRAVQVDPKQPKRSIPWTTQQFIERWIDLLRSGVQVADSQAHRELVRRREQRHKGKRSRLDNQRLLQMWQGAAGTTRLAYRWTQVQMIIADIHDGLDADRVAA